MTIRVQLENCWTRILDATPVEIDWVENYLSCADSRFQVRNRRNPAFMAENDPVFCMFDRVGRVFPSGLLHNMRGAARAEGIDIEVDDVREIPCAIEPDDVAGLDWLRDYQLDAVHKACRRTRGLIDAPTGSGKSEVFIGLTKKLPCEWLFVVHRKGLVRQIADRYRKRTGETAGTFEAGIWARGTSNVTVATFQAIHRAMTAKLSKARRANPIACLDVHYLLKSIEALFVDECHNQAADTWNAVSMAMERAYYRFGTSATCLDKSDRENMRVMAATGPFAYRISHQMLVDRGILAKSVVRMVECAQWNYAPGSSWVHVYRDLLVHSRVRNGIVATMVQQAVKPCLCFVNQIAHGRNLMEMFTATGLRVEFVHGKDSEEVRQVKARELDRANVDVILCTVVWQEGIDIPGIKSVVCAAGGKSTVAAIQRRGRGTRIAAGAGGDVFELWDVLDTGQPWLSEHAELRAKAYESRGDMIQIGWK